MVEKIFKFMVVRLLENTFATQKKKIKRFLFIRTDKTFPHVLIITSQAEEDYSSLRQHFFKNLFPPAQIGGGNYESAILDGNSTKLQTFANLTQRSAFP